VPESKQMPDFIRIAGGLSVLPISVEVPSRLTESQVKKDFEGKVSQTVNQLVSQSDNQSVRE